MRFANRLFFFDLHFGSKSVISENRDFSFNLFSPYALSLTKAMLSFLFWALRRHGAYNQLASALFVGEYKRQYKPQAIPPSDTRIFRTVVVLPRSGGVLKVHSGAYKCDLGFTTMLVCFIQK